MNNHSPLPLPHRPLPGTPFIFFLKLGSHHFVLYFTFIILSLISIVSYLRELLDGSTVQWSLFESQPGQFLFSSPISSSSLLGWGICQWWTGSLNVTVALCAREWVFTCHKLKGQRLEPGPQAAIVYTPALCLPSLSVGYMNNLLIIPILLFNTQSPHLLLPDFSLFNFLSYPHYPPS